MKPAWQALSVLPARLAPPVPLDRLGLPVLLDLPDRKASQDLQDPSVPPGLPARAARLD